MLFGVILKEYRLTLVGNISKHTVHFFFLKKKKIQTLASLYLCELKSLCSTNLPTKSNLAKLNLYKILIIIFACFRIFSNAWLAVVFGLFIIIIIFNLFFLKKLIEFELKNGVIIFPYFNVLKNL